MSNTKWQEVGAMALEMAALSELEIEYFEENGDEDDGIAYWTESRNKWVDRFTDWLHMNSGHQKPMTDCYLTALELVNEVKKEVRGVE